MLHSCTKSVWLSPSLLIGCTIALCILYSGRKVSLKEVRQITFQTNTAATYPKLLAVAAVLLCELLAQVCNAICNLTIFSLGKLVCSLRITVLSRSNLFTDMCSVKPIRFLLFLCSPCRSLYCVQPLRLQLRILRIQSSGASLCNPSQALLACCIAPDRDCSHLHSVVPPSFRF